MCIIAAKPMGVALPEEETIKRMWTGNSDGAGFMYAKDGRVCIEKGFMKYKDFISALRKLGEDMDLTETAMVLHFRITTHGGTKPENTHPFPVSDNVGMLKKLKCKTDVGVAHNGIIHSVSPRKDISDTMEYIVSQLAPLKKALPSFYKSKDALVLIKNAIESKMSFLTADGSIYTVGDFIEDGGMLYSNTSYQGFKMYGNFDFKCYGGYYPDDDDFYGTEGTLGLGHLEADDAIMVNWLYYGEGYIRTKEGNLLSGDDYLVDEIGRVWAYDYTYDTAVLVEGATAFSASGLPWVYNEDEADAVFVATGVVAKE